MPSVFSALVQDGSVTLSWEQAADCNGGAVAGYNLYRSTRTGGGYEKLNTELITDTAYVDAGLEDGATFYYVVKAVDADGDESLPTAELSITTGSRTLTVTTSDAAGGGGGGCFISTVSGTTDK